MNIDQELEECGELILVLGDFHIPTRKEDICENFKNLLVPHKVSKVICTGNIGGIDNLNWIKSLSSNVYIAKVIPWGDTDALFNYQKRLNIDVLISGHTHEANVYKVEGKYFLNPGSITGAYSPLKSDNTPSFMLLDVRKNSMIVYVYQEVQGEIKIERMEITKDK